MSQLSALSSSSPHVNSHHAPRSSNPSPPPDSATDPAQLLRQAALSSRKLKRRKLDASASGVSLSRPLSRSIASTPSISLDYGQEEPSSTPTTSQQPPPAQTPARASTPAQTFPPGSPSRDIKRDDSTEPPPQTPLDDDASMREEGEISENEDSPFRPPSQSMSAPITGAGVKYADMAPGTVRSPPFGVMSRSPSVMVEDAYQHVNPATTPARLPSTEGQRPPLSESFRLETPNYVLDPDHVRPGLALTQKQYDTAKGVILDILGYGVPPEYLIDCGISKEIIYYVFTELNLRLPSNLVTRGIHPYPPPLDVIQSILRSQSGYPLSPLAAVFPTADGDLTRPGSVEHRNLSPGPPTPHDSTSTATPQVATTESTDSSLSASVLALSESTLTTIERQRKQELLARKAVQASRKRKESVPLSLTQSSTGTPSAGPDISATSSASAVSVEDFFNSIELPPSDTADPKRDPDEVKAPELVKQSSPEPMSVDEGIPGFGLNTVSGYDYPIPSADRASVGAFLRRSTSAENWNALVEREKEVPTHKASQGPENLPTRSRSDGVLAPHLAKDSEGDSRRPSSTPQPTAPIPRRGAKRPVAADFDSEPIPKGYTPPGGLSRTGSGTGFSNGGGYHPNPHVRRKMNGVIAGGFASLNSARRCVIDVSDSEEETSGDEMPSTASAPRGARPQGAASGGTQSSAGDSALALELEIERMRKIIREREEMKLRKDAMASSRATPVSRESPAMCRSAEGEGDASEMAALSSRSETGNDKASKNVLATSTAPSSLPRLDVNCPSPISSTPSPPRFPPLSPSLSSPSRDGTFTRAATRTTTFTDQSATPADDERAIGGPALAAEPRPESAASSRASTPPQATWPVLHRHSPETGQNVDIIASVQVSNQLQVMTDSWFIAYDSVLSHYPFLSGRSLGPQEMADIPNLKGLRMQAAARRMTDSAADNTRICQFEVPGGGECRDRTCGDMHLNQFEMEPNDEETARYLCGNQDQDVAQIVRALQTARARRPEASFDERVKEVWASMRGRRIQVTSDGKT